MSTKAKRRAGFSVADQPAAIREAIGHLKDARWLLRNCGSKNAADAVRRALKSAEGAERHALNMNLSWPKIMDAETMRRIESGE